MDPGIIPVLAVVVPKIRTIVERKKKRSTFFAVFNFGITHESQVWSQGDKELYVNPDEINVPPIFPDTAEVRKDWL